VNRPINFPALVFLLLFALMLLLNGSAILSWASRPVFGSGRSIDGPAVEKASLVHPPVAGPFPDPVEIKVSANYQQEYSSVDAGLNKPPEKFSDVPNSPKNQMHPRGHRLTANLMTRIHSRPVHLGEQRLSQKVGAFWQEVRINGRRLKKRLTSLLRSAQHRGY
jgi:hypothetical protein